MKKTLLMVGLLASAMAAQAQVTTLVLQPSDLAGPLEFTLPTPADWGPQFPDMNILANAVQQFAVIGQDSTACLPLTNAADIAGKIAIVYRGTCEFGLKALNAQNAGAVAVVIVNNQGAPVPMGAGVNGALVTIPTVMISTDGGASIHDAVMAGTVEMYIGTVQGLYANNLAISKTDVFLPSASAIPSPLLTDPNDFNVMMGSWIHNFGSANQAAVTLNASVMHNGSSVYDQTSPSVAIPSGDSVFITLPVFDQNAYSGRYDISYTTEFGITDEFPSDNTYTTSFQADSLLALGPIDPSTNLPYYDEFIRSSTPPPAYFSCMQFINPHASKLIADGIYAAASVATTGNITGVQLNAHIFEWGDAVTGESDATFTNVSEIINGAFVYTDSTQTSEPQYIPFLEATPLVDNQRYLFCISVTNPDVFLAHNTHVDYDENSLITDQFANIMQLDTWTVGGWNDRAVPALAVSMHDATIGIRENNVENLTPYPNPTAKFLTIPMKGNSGKATLTVFDAKGAQVLNKQVTVGSDNKLTMDLQDFNAGSYLFNMTFENGNRSKFRVVVNK
ncbi:MAG: PA domain-containing protein [Flavobacteriales bacterium]